MDMVTLEVIRHRLFAIAEEMGAALVRTSYSINIKDRRDASCALFTVNGDTIAQAEHVPLHLGVLTWGVKGALQHIDVAGLQPGDAIVHNDPYIGGTHLPDIIIFAPIFFQGRLMAFSGTLAHHVDVGGKVPGSLAPDATEIFQEGLRLPPVKLRKAGKLDQEILAIHGRNVRTPYESQGDLLAQLAATNVGDRRFAELCEEFGPETVQEAITELDRYCERRMAAELSALPAGTFSFTDILEGDGVSHDILTIKVTVTTGGPRLLIDFTGTGPQTRGPLNAIRPMTLACVYYVAKCVTDPSIPPNAGTYRPLEVITPEGTLVNARFPAATGLANGSTCQRIVDTLLGALAQVVPERVCAAGTGSFNSARISGFNQETRTYFSHGDTYGGGYGAACDQDGTSGVHTHMSNTLNTPVEVLEQSLPVRVEGYGLVPDSEGPGLYRGGFGITRVMRVLVDGTSCRISTDRVGTPPWGLAGGHPARGSRFATESGGVLLPAPSHVFYTLKAGDRIFVETSGGGGWGDPRLRDPAKVAADVRDGLVSPERAASKYGVQVDAGGRVDPAATARLREEHGG